MTPYKLELVQALKTDDREKCKQFCVAMQEKLEDEELKKCLVFSDEATFHTNGKVSKHNIRIWGKEIPMLQLST